jgi:hypothetical protein
MVNLHGKNVFDSYFVLSMHKLFIYAREVRDVNEDCYLWSYYPSICTSHYNEVMIEVCKDPKHC